MTLRQDTLSSCLCRLSAVGTAPVSEIDASPHLTLRSQRTDFHQSSVWATVISHGSFLLLKTKQNKTGFLSAKKVYR